MVVDNFNYEYGKRDYFIKKNDETDASKNLGFNDALRFPFPLWA